MRKRENPGVNLWDHVTPDMLLNGYQRPQETLDEWLGRTLAPATEGPILRPHRAGLTRWDRAALILAGASATLAVGALLWPR